MVQLLTYQFLIGTVLRKAELAEEEFQEKMRINSL